jgi:hypothetical protein
MNPPKRDHRLATGAVDLDDDVALCRRLRERRLRLPGLS